jgi:hypothetical protein
MICSLRGFPGLTRSCPREPQWVARNRKCPLTHPANFVIVGLVMHRRSRCALHINGANSSRFSATQRWAGRCGRARSRASGMRRIGLFLSTLPADDPRGQARITAFVQRLQELGWTDGRNMRIAHRWVRKTNPGSVIQRGASDPAPIVQASFSPGR